MNRSDRPAPDALPHCPAAGTRGEGGAHAFLGSAHGANRRRLLAVVALTLAAMLAEVIAGYVFGSMALLADGWHMAGHAVALGVSAFAYDYAHRHADNPRYSFGTGKIGDLAAFASSVLLAGVALLMAVESVGRLIEPAPIAYREALIVAVVGLLVNLASAALLHRGAGHNRGHQDHDHAHGDGRHRDHDHAHAPQRDHNLRSAYLHVLADALTSMLAIGALLAGALRGWTGVDPLVGIVGAVIILRWAFGLARQTAAVLLDASADPQLARRVRGALEAGGDVRVCDLHLWRLAPGRFALIVSLRAARPGAPAEYKARLQSFEQLAHVTVEVETT